MKDLAAQLVSILFFILLLGAFLFLIGASVNDAMIHRSGYDTSDDYSAEPDSQ